MPPTEEPSPRDAIEARDTSEPEAPAVSIVGRVLRVLLGLLAGLAVAGGVGYWQGVKPGAVAQYVAGVSPLVVIGCVLSSYVVMAFQALRWHLVMSPLLGLRYAQAYEAQMVGQMFNALLPARGGDLLRVQYLGRRTGKSRATILGTEVVDRWLDWWGWIPLLLVMSLTSKLPSWLYTALGIFAALLVTWATVMLVLARRGWEPRQGSRIGTIFASFQTGIRSFQSKRMLAIAVAVAPLCWAWEVVALMVASHFFGIHLTLGMAFSVLIGFNLAMVVPSPGGIGTIEAGGMAALVFFGVDKERALAFMFIYHFSQLLPTIATGVGILVAQGERMFGGAQARAGGDAPAPTPETSG